ncbi:MAG TPA: hypothetical protein DCS39_01475 [Rhodobiaceae bacterium]|nr:hypothetical protein [Rhodobiaceae bacterium]
MKRLLRIISGSIILLAMIAVLLYGGIRAFGLPLGFLTQSLSAVLTTLVPQGSVDIKEGRLGWSSENNFFALSIGNLRIREAANAGLLAEDIYIELSGPAFWNNGRLAISKAIIEKLTLMPTRVNDLPAATSLFLPSGGGPVEGLQYISEIGVRDIRVQSDGNPDGNGSHFLMMRRDSRISASVQIEYQGQDSASSIIGTAEIKNDGSGQAEIALSSFNPRDIGRFSKLLAPLRGIQLPVTAMINVNFSEGGRPKDGLVDLYVNPGIVQLTGARLDVRELVAGAAVDFKEREVIIRDVRFNVAGVAGQLAGSANYQLNENARLSKLNFSMQGNGASVDLPKYFKEIVNISRSRFNGVFDFSKNALEVDALELEHDFGKAKATGIITLAERNPHFDITANFGSMSRAGTEALWPITISPNARKWTEANLVGGALRSGSLSINASLQDFINRKRTDPMREETMLLDLDFENIGVRYLAHLPILENTEAQFKLRGSSMEVSGKGGVINLPSNTEDVSPVQVETVLFFTPNYRDRLQPVDINFSGSGVSRDILRAINLPPLRALGRINFDFERLLGDVRAEVDLRVPVFAPPEQRKVSYQIEAETRNLHVGGKAGPFKITNGRGLISLNNAGLSAMGRVEANGVDSGFSWLQPFGAADPDDARLAVHGFFSPQDIADLGQGWAATRIEGNPHINLLISGPITKPKNYRLFADLKSAKLTLQPLAFEKPVGDNGSIEAVLENGADGKIEEIRARLNLPKQKPARITMKFDGPLMTDLEMTPWSLGRDQNLQARVETVNNQRLVNLTADKLDVSRLFFGGNRKVKLPPSDFTILPFLGNEAVVEVQAKQLVGANKVNMDGARLRVVREKGLHEKLAFQGVFSDGTDLLMDIERDTVFRRKFFVQTERAGNLFRMLDWVDELYGGALVVQGNIYDEQQKVDGRPRDLNGRLIMTDYRARNVPVLASIVSLASLRGISDTLSGDGIKFEKAQGNFSFGNGRLNIKKGRMHGPAVGITMQGDYDVGSGDVDIGGTVIPSYTLNSFFGKIPIVGPLLSGRRGEGVIGIGYRVSGEAGKANVLVNPLSVLTPGFLRRVFEIGIGLGDGDKDSLPEMEEPDLAK